MKASEFSAEKKRLLEKIRASEAMFRSIAEASHDALVVIGEDARIKEVNSSAEQMFGWKRKELLGQSVEVLIPECDHQGHRKSFAELIKQGTSGKFPKSHQLEAIHKNGTRFPAEIIISRVKTDRQWTFTASIRNVTEYRRLERALAEQAIRDSLTDLYNRRYFPNRVEEEISRSGRSRAPFGILLCDLDRFKAINDARGHRVGDKVLKTVAKKIQDCTRGMDLVFRWGEDEFVIVLSNTTREGALIASDRIRKGIHKIGEKIHLNLDVSIGIAIYPEHGSSPDELIHLADQALYIAKKGKDKIHIGAEEYKLDEHSIKVVFQPVMDIRSNQVLGYEALSRDPQGKLGILELFEKYQAIGKLNELNLNPA